jgi:23S rRNA (cytidine1920-2'-O)/16S rRNA (cytidine1409-2'-O)-methyltransferase
VRRGLAPSRTRARDDIESGRVIVGGAPAGKPARLVAPDEPIEILGPGPRFVSRGGEKLDAALTRFDVDPVGWRVIDCGASTGGFTDALLQRGATQVIAIDVGYGQLHERLRADPRVVSFERTSVRGIDPATVGGPAPLVVADLSFISLRKVMADLVALCTPDGHVVVLVKPQFEAGRDEASRGRGVISDPTIWRRVLDEVHDALVSHRAAIMDVMTSPIRGADGNVEFVVHARVGATPVDRADAFAAAVDSATRLRDGRG